VSSFPHTARLGSITVWTLPTLHKGTVAFSALRALAKNMPGTLVRGHMAHMFPDLLYPLPALASQTVPGVRVSTVPTSPALVHMRQAVVVPPPRSYTG
jgi:hypothetical protein